MTFEKFAIYEGNLERLTKKLNTIANKCKTHGCEFHFKEVGEEFRPHEDEDGTTSLLRFVIVEVGGKAIVNGWEFVATLDPMEKTNQNIIRKFNYDVEIPARYYIHSNICEHCRTNRLRGQLFLVHNTETGEFKQVGRSCLKEFTGGLDAEQVARYISYFDEIIKGESVIGFTHLPEYSKVRENLLYAAECVRKFGYQSSEVCPVFPTKVRVHNYYAVRENGWRYHAHPKEAENYKEDWEKVNFNPYSEENQKFVDEALAWIKCQMDDTNYFHNLISICSQEYVRYRDLGYLVSLVPTYMKEVKYQEDRKLREAQKTIDMKSEWLGEVGQKVSVDCVSARCVTSFDTQYGVTFLYEFKDAEGNICKWFSSNCIDGIERSVKVEGKVKDHSTYNDVKETVLTRCKVTLGEKKQADHEPATKDVDEAMDMFMKSVS